MVGVSPRCIQVGRCFGEFGYEVRINYLRIVLPVPKISCHIVAEDLVTRQIVYLLDELKGRVTYFAVADSIPVKPGVVASFGIATLVSLE